MAFRVSVADVKKIIEIDSAVTDAEVEIFITSANILTNKVNTTGGITDATQLKEIERWLSAHFVAIRDMRAASEQAGPVNASYQHQLGLNFNVTMYGQQALILDTSGTLAAMQEAAASGGSRKASLNLMYPDNT